MSPLDLLWLVLVLLALQPVLRQKWLERARQRLILKLERLRGSRVVLLVHRQETMSLAGFPMLRYIDIEDAEEVIHAIQLTDPEVPLDLVLHTPGGLVLASMQIARAIAQHRGRVTVLVPHYAMSGGTLIALAADEIVMSPHAVLGPVDPQIGDVPATSLLKLLEIKPVEQIADDTLILADQAAKAIDQVHESVLELLGDKMGPEQAEELAVLLSEGTWTHDHPITFAKARALGLTVSDAMPPEVMALMQLYAQPIRWQPTVEYLPAQRHVDGAPRR